MTITGQNLGKKFGSQWVFKDINFHLKPGDSLALTGVNGSGKSTLLQMISGALTPSRGQVNYLNKSQTLDFQTAIRKINFCAPYVELIDEFTLSEFLNFHSKFRIPRISKKEIPQKMKLQNALHKPISQFSSGMKQRIKLGLQFYFEGSVIALDEPTTNLDEQGKDWYKSEIKNMPDNRLIIIASNDPFEYDFCKEKINIF